MLTTETILEFGQIKEMLCSYAMSEQAKGRLAELAPTLKEWECRRWMEETTEARRVLDVMGNPPLASVREMDRILGLSEKGAMLSPEQLECVAGFLTSCKRMKAYLERAESLNVGLADYGRSMDILPELLEEITAAVQNGGVLDTASPALRDIRRKIDNQAAQIKRKLDDLLRSRRSCFSDGYVSQRNGRYVLPVKREYKNQISGTLIGTSSTGGTCFIEPAAVSKLQDQINLLEIEADNEIRRILYTLTALVDEAAPTLKIDVEAMVTLDFAFAKAKLSAELRAVPVPVETSRAIQIRQGRHPLLRREECVPLDFSIGGEIRGVVITGPNTGGKTVALKTVGLLSMMAQSGLHVPVESGSFSMNNLILCDIGDGQSIAENLSTFSAHISNIIQILSQAGEQSLVLLDELGSGTDPAEGMGIAVSILEELRTKNCLFLATTHYPEVKAYAANTDGLVNARMAFDRESLKPLYRLEIGEAGESCALYIAKRLGFPAHMLERARDAAYHAAPVEAVLDDTLAQDAAKSLPQTHGPIVEKAARPQKPCGGQRFQLGDSVTVHPGGELGIVFRPMDGKGRVGVQIRGEKNYVSYKRLRMKTPAQELYPPDYDFSIIFDSVENRKTRRQMDKRHVPGAEIAVTEYDPG